MKHILSDLNESIGARRSVILTTDGITVASVFEVSVNDDLISALIDSLIRGAGRSPHGIGFAPFATAVLSADYGRIVFVALHRAYLVVVLDPGSPIDPELLSIRSAAAEIERRVRIAV